MAGEVINLLTIMRDGGLASFVNQRYMHATEEC